MVLQTKTSVIIILFLSLLMVSCGNGKSKLPAVDLNIEELPMVHTEDIVSLISDSGITRYRVTTKVWDMFQNDTASYWYFPEGVYVEAFDSLFNVQATVKADTAYYYQNRSLWRGIGNVFIQNEDGVQLETDELFWNEKAPPTSNYAIYTDKLVRVVTPDGTIVRGLGMNSDLSMKYYVFHSASFETELQDTGITKQENDSTLNNDEEVSKELIREKDKTAEKTASPDEKI